jgi:N-acetylated-alpha-linked acidic dipeptidase
MTKHLLLVLLLPVALRADDKPLLGFTPRHAEEECVLERRFDGSLRAETLRVHMKRLSARPHHVGSPYGKQNAEFIADRFSSWGFETKIEQFDVLFPTPKIRLLEMTAPVAFTATLAEPAVEGDSTSGQADEQLPVYNAYSIDGDVTGELVYVNFGIPKDYDELALHGIDVKGKIVIARYGGSWRGIKPKVAAEHGAIGCIIYSDPKDDGFFQGDVYPKGPFRSDYGAQRGSVADMPLHSGDPLTPFIGATKNAKRLSLAQAKTLTKIPVLPIASHDALPLLSALTGPVAPEQWRGALPITYHIGPGPARVHLTVTFNWDLKPVYDVIARMNGSERPDEWIIRGNHHDAWVNGADDPVSGLVALMEEARGVGMLAREGWKPKRTIIFAAWDGEEPGLLGSTEWVETHADELKTKTAVYINSDSNGRGFLGAGGSHILERFINQAVKDVLDPEKHVSVAERARARRLLEGSPEEQRDARDRADLRIGALGSGSDYTPFFQHLGITSCTIGYGGENDGGSYHSIYDSYSHYIRFGDPTFAYGVTLAKTTGRLVLRLANADILPFEFTNSAETIGNYAREVAKLLDDLRTETDEQNSRIKNHTLELVADPTLTYVVPKPKDQVPYLNFAPLQNAVSLLQQSARAFDTAAQSLPTGADAQRSIDEILLGAERFLTRKEGLPRRPWFVHQIYAPGFYTGYGVKTLPGIREAIEQRNWKEAGEEVEIVASSIVQFANEINRAADLLRQRR